MNRHVTPSTPAPSLRPAGARLRLACATGWIAACSAVFGQAAAGEGEVRKIDIDSGKLTLTHGALPAFDMPAMTMTVRVKDVAWLKTLQSGDRVRFTLERVNGQYTLTALEAQR